MKNVKNQLIFPWTLNPWVSGVCGLGKSLFFWAASKSTKITIDIQIQINILNLNHQRQCDSKHCKVSRNLHLAPCLPTGASPWSEGLYDDDDDDDEIGNSGDIRLLWNIVKTSGRSAQIWRWGRWISALGESWLRVWKAKKVENLPPSAFSPGACQHQHQNLNKPKWTS